MWTTETIQSRPWNCHVVKSTSSGPVKSAHQLAFDVMTVKQATNIPRAFLLWSFVAVLGRAKTDPWIAASWRRREFSIGTGKEETWRSSRI